MIKFEFSEAPPSANNSTSTVNGRKIKSLRYRNWCAKADVELMLQPGKLRDPCYWSLYILIPGDGSRADLTNLEKAITDALVRGGRVPDDRYLVDFRMRYHAGSMVIAAATEEDLEKWALIRKASKSVITKLAKSSRLR